MSRVRRMRREDRRAFLLDTAATLIDQGGVGALSFESLADAAEVTKTLPYAYFESKDEILLTLFDHVIGRIDGEVEALLASDAAFETVVEQSLDVWFAAAKDHGRLVGALLDGRSIPALAAAIRRRDRASTKLWHDLVAVRFGLRDSEAQVLAAMLNTTATATVELWISKRGSRSNLIDAFVKIASSAALGLQAR